MEPTAPLFSLQGPEWAPSASIGTITHLVCSNGSIYVGGSTGKIVRLGIGTGQFEEQELPLAYRSPQVHALYADTYSAWALIAVCRPADTIYFCRGKGRLLGKARGTFITSVAWLQKDAGRPDVRDVLFGTQNGIIYEAALEPQRTKYFRQLHAIHPCQAVVGLQVLSLHARACGPDFSMLTPTVCAIVVHRSSLSLTVMLAAASSWPSHRTGCTSLWAAPRWRPFLLRVATVVPHSPSR